MVPKRFEMSPGSIKTYHWQEVWNQNCYHLLYPQCTNPKKLYSWKVMRQKSYIAELWLTSILKCHQHQAKHPTEKKSEVETAITFCRCSASTCASGQNCYHLLYLRCINLQKLYNWKVRRLKSYIAEKLVSKYLEMSPRSSRTTWKVIYLEGKKTKQLYTWKTCFLTHQSVTEIKQNNLKSYIAWRHWGRKAI